MVAAGCNVSIRGRAALLFLLLLPVAVLTACTDRPPPPALSSVTGVRLGALHDGTALVVGRGSLEGRAVVVTYFGTG